MEQIIELLIEYAAIWGPSLVAIAGIIVSVVTALSKIASAIAETKAAVASLKEDATIKELTNELKKQASKNERLQETYTLLLDKITHIKGYTDIVLPKDKEE